MLGRDEEDIMARAGDGEAGQVERLGIDFSVDAIHTDFAEGGGLYICLCKDSLLRIEAVSVEVVVVGRDVGNGDVRGGGRHRRGGRGGRH